MPTIRRSALVEHSASRMFDLVNDVAAYPRRFGWCDAANVLEQDQAHIVARLDLGLGSFRTWFTTENILERPERIVMHLRDGPFKRLEGLWEFHALGMGACKESVTLEVET
ncbi:type II toxin-antitoxin system RatA family toxin, partial [Xanthomonas perforans]|uniref:type II toxin-antitoxin system RatA family toxin n=1 Tax=Xanthomonas perforans TaxID=442694 RepID=UPI001F306334